MVLPEEIGDAAQDGDQDRVFAWLAAGGDINDDENVIAMKALVAGVRKHGTYKKYMRAPHREVLACRGLVMRGYLAPTGTRRPRGPHKWKAAVTFLAKQGDNGIVWNILCYWRATE